MDSLSVIGVLPDKVVIWIQFGTRYFIDYIYLIIGIPLLIDFLIVWSPKMGLQFGQSNGEQQSDDVIQESSSENTVHNVHLDDRFKFMYIYARNPNLFTSKESVHQLDEEIKNIKSSYTNADKNNASSASAYSANNSKKKIADKKKKKAPIKKSTTSYGLRDRLLKNGLNTIHLTFIGVVVLVNIVGYIHYSSIFDKFFVLTEKGYSLNYQALDATTPEERQEVFNMQIKVEQINEVKYLPKSQ